MPWKHCDDPKAKRWSWIASPSFQLELDSDSLVMNRMTLRGVSGWIRKYSFYLFGSSSFKIHILAKKLGAQLPCRSFWKDHVERPHRDTERCRRSSSFVFSQPRHETFSAQVQLTANTWKTQWEPPSWALRGEHKTRIQGHLTLFCTWCYKLRCQFFLWSWRWILFGEDIHSASPKITKHVIFQKCVYISAV